MVSEQRLTVTIDIRWEADTVTLPLPLYLKMLETIRVSDAERTYHRERTERLERERLETDRQRDEG